MLRPDASYSIRNLYKFLILCTSQQRHMSSGASIFTEHSDIGQLVI